MLYFLYALFFISCVVLVASVLLQPGKTDAGALFTSNVSSTAFSPRGTASVLSKFTIGAGVVFMLSALMISMPAFSGNLSVLQGNAETPAETPASNTAAPTAQTVVEGGQTQKIVIPADANSNSTTVVTMPAGDAANAKPANGAKTTAVPIQPNPPANK